MYFARNVATRGAEDAASPIFSFSANWKHTNSAIQRCIMRKLVGNILVDTLGTKNVFILANWGLCTSPKISISFISVICQGLCALKIMENASLLGGCTIPILK